MNMSNPMWFSVPGWAQKEDGCMLTSLPSLTVSYLPDQGAVELISDCGLEGTRRIACKGQAVSGLEALIS